MELQILKANRIQGVVKAPPSKSLTHRAFIAALLADGTSKINHPLYADDTLSSARACQALGAELKMEDEFSLIEGRGEKLKTPENIVDLHNSGTTLRIMTSVAALSPYYTVLTGDKSLRKRPMEDLLVALKGLGVTAFSSRNNGLPPIIVKGGFRGGKTHIKGDVSSQFISSILMAAPYAEDSVEIMINGEFISQPYVELTQQVMKAFGVNVEYNTSPPSFTVYPQRYLNTEYAVEGDYSSASYLIAAAAAFESDLTVQNLFRNSKQGDRVILDVVQEMGCEVKVKKDEINIYGKGDLKGLDVDLRNAPDLLPTVAALGAIAQGTTRISGVEHARYKETDRIHNCALELVKMGVQVKEKKDGLIIRGGVRGGVVDSHNDHRLVMAFYIIGLKVGGVKIKNASVYEVSYPNFPTIMEKLIVG